MKPLQLQCPKDVRAERKAELARLRAAGKHKLAEAAERLWSALAKRGAR
jgi:hypothetical protein